MFIRILSILAGTALAMAAGAAPATRDIIPAQILQPDMITPWYNGALTSIGTDIACLSDPPLPETRVMGYAGFSHPPGTSPAVGEVYYTHLVLSHPGNPCAGSAVAIELILPPGVQTANSVENPMFCFAILPNPQRLYNLDNDVDYGCPQSYPQGLQGLAVMPLRGGIGNSGAWGMHRGFWLELLIPLRATQAQAGNNSIYWRVNPDIGVVGYPMVASIVNDDIIFRSAMEDNMLTLDICTITPTPQGC